MAVATGGMKPCLAPFGAEQFILPQQKLRLQQYFSVFFIATTVGNMAATSEHLHNSVVHAYINISLEFEFFLTVLTPVLRKNVSCFGADTCYPMAFGTSTIAMFFAVGWLSSDIMDLLGVKNNKCFELVIFLVGNLFYKKKKSEGNMVIKVLKCVQVTLCFI